MKLLFFIFLIISGSNVLAFEETEGMRSMRLGCEKQKLGLGCHNYANFLIKNDRETEADAYFEKGCKLAHQESCEKKRWESLEQSTSVEVAPSEAVEELPLEAN